MAAPDVVVGGVPASSTLVLSQAMRLLADRVRAGAGPDIAVCVEALAMEEAADRLLDLHHLAARCLPVVQSHNQAEHMMDGLSGCRPRASDALLRHLRQEAGS